METTPQPQIEPVEAVQTINQGSKRLVKILLVVVAAVIVLGAALWAGSRHYYQVRPLTSIGVNEGQSSLETSSSSMNDDFSLDEEIKREVTDYDLSSVTISKQSCGIISIDTQDSELSSKVISDLTTELCTLFKQQGKETIKHSVIFPVSSNTIKLGIITSAGRSYLVSFSVDGEDDETHIISLNTAHLLNISNISKIASKSVNNKDDESDIVEVTGTDVSGKETQEYFEIISMRHVGYVLVEILKNSDGTFSDVISTDSQHNNVADVRFLVPHGIGSYSIQGSDRDGVMETENKVSPIYHKTGCGLDDAYGDIDFELDNYKVTVSINFGFYPNLNITTAESGYDPKQWGKVLEKISMTDFIASVQKNKALRSNSPAEILTISGYQVKHIGPTVLERSCQYSGSEISSDIYQVVKNGAVITFNISSSSYNYANAENAQKLISQILTTLTFSKQ